MNFNNITIIKYSFSHSKIKITCETSNNQVLYKKMAKIEKTTEIIIKKMLKLVLMLSFLSCAFFNLRKQIN